MACIDKIWYEKSPYAVVGSLILRPLSWVFALCSALRRMLYEQGVLKSSAPLVPVIIVGGLSAGGSGKTPLCVALIKELQRRGYKVGLLSRGYRAKAQQFPWRVMADGDAVTCGDEPLLINRQTGAEVVIDPKRPRGAFYLASLGVDVIICDDGLQHYALKRDGEIVVVDGVRMFGNKKSLPSGPLREGLWRLKKVDEVVINGAVAKLGYNTMVLHPTAPIALDGSAITVPKGAKVIALAGIGNPTRFYKTLEDFGFAIAEVLTVGDHGTLPCSKIATAAQRYPVIMTAKDAIKYEGQKLANVFVLNVEAFLAPAFYDGVEQLIKSAINRIELRARRQQAQGAQGNKHE